MAIPRGVRQLLFAGCFVAGFLVPSGSINLPAPSRSISKIQRVTTPDGQTDAVAVVAQIGLLKSHTRYEVYVVKHGASFSRVTPVFAGIEMEHPALVWAGSHLLEVHYDRARIEAFRNSSRLPNESPVEIRLAPMSLGFSSLNESGSRP